MKTLKKSLFLGCWALYLLIQGVFLTPIAQGAAGDTLNLLNFGEVIQIQPTDTTMLDCPMDTQGCLITTNNVLPFKFVKMMARESDGSEINKDGYTYWMFLDNYCWWGNAHCRYNGDSINRIYPNQQSWNGTGSGYHNNISDVLAPNVLDILANFYDSLPPIIDGMLKSDAVPTHDFDFMPQSFVTTAAPTPAWTSSMLSNWPATDTTYNPNGNTNSAFTFLGTVGNADPRTRSKISLPSYTEWQGGLVGYRVYTNQSSTNGSGGSYCYARFGNNTCAASTGYTFDDANTDLTVGIVGANAVASATNPRPRYPWTRTATSTDETSTFRIYGSSSTSITDGSTYNNRGVSPTLWLASSIRAGEGAGIYTNPYTINTALVDPASACALLENKNKLACLNFSEVIQMTPTDTAMLDCVAGIGGCSTTTDEVLPFKFVKMQARESDGNMLGDEEFGIYANPADSKEYTYWMFLDNYCWWGNALCRYSGTSANSIYPNQQGWNGTGSSNRSNNISEIKNLNILAVLANFYDSLPAKIGHLEKNEAILLHNFDFMPMTLNSSFPVVGWTTEVGGNWPTIDTIYNPNSNIDSAFTFLGTVGNGDPRTRSRISLPSYMEWQGGPKGYNTVSGQSFYNGSGGSHCFARYGLQYCYVDGEYVYDDAVTLAGTSNGGDQATTVSNPRPRYPWTRTANATEVDSVFRVRSGSSYVLAGNSASSGNGVSPVLWLAADLEVGDGSGTYSDPYIFDDFCTDPTNKNKLACLVGAAVQIVPQTTADKTIGNFKFLVTNKQKNDAMLAVMLDNYCEWNSDDCETNDGTKWNDTSGDTYGINDLSSGNNNDVNKITYQLNNFYHLGLPATIGGMSKDSAVRTTTWDMNAFSATSIPTYNTCPVGWSTTNSTVDFTFIGDGSAVCNMTSKVALVSALEWQGNGVAHGNEPVAGAVGNLFCKLRFDSACKDSNPLAIYNNPWTRSASEEYTYYIWRIGSSADLSLNYSHANGIQGLLPALYLDADLETICGSGTYEEPYHFVGDPCNVAPSTPLINTYISSTWYSGNVATISGRNAVDSDGDDLVMYFSVDEGNTWEEVVKLNITNVLEGSFSATLDISKFSEDTYPLIIKINDGTLDSEESDEASLNIDRTAPTCNVNSWNPSEALWKNEETGTRFTISCSDTGGSGLDPIVVTPYCITGNTHGATCPIQIYDNASNVSLRYYSPVNRVDMDIPTGVITVTGGESSGSSESGDLVYQISPAISYTATDPNTVGVDASGVDGVRSTWILDTQEIPDQVRHDTCAESLDEVSFTGNISIEDIEIPRNGTHTFCTQAKDIAGNLSIISSQTFTLDTSIPTVSGEIIGSPALVGGWYTTYPTLEITAYDNNGSGLNGIYYRTFEASMTASLPDDYDVTSDTSATFIAATASGQLTQTHHLSFWGKEGNFYVYYGAKDTTTTVDPSETLNIQIKIDGTKPVSIIESVESTEPSESIVEVPLSSDDANYALYQNTNLAFPNAMIGAQILVDMNTNASGSGEMEVLTVNTASFDPLYPQLTTPPPPDTTSGVHTCLLEMRTANIFTDGTGKIESIFDEILNQVQDDNGESDMTPSETIEVINFSNWTALSTTCSDNYDLIPQANTLYQLRYTVTDHAGHTSLPYVFSSVIYNLDELYRQNFVVIDGNVLGVDLATNIYTMECKEDQLDNGEDGIAPQTCTPDHFDVTGKLSATSKEADYRLCLTINDTNITKCTTVTTSTNSITNFAFQIANDEFPNDIDIFLGGLLTVTNTDTNESITKQVNMVWQIKRDKPQINPETKSRDYVRMMNGRFN